MLVSKSRIRLNHYFSNFYHTTIEAIKLGEVVYNPGIERAVKHIFLTDQPFLRGWAPVHSKERQPMRE